MATYVKKKKKSKNAHSVQKIDALIKESLSQSQPHLYRIEQLHNEEASFRAKTWIWNSKESAFKGKNNQQLVRRGMRCTIVQSEEDEKLCEIKYIPAIVKKTQCIVMLARDLQANGIFGHTLQGYPIQDKQYPTCVFLLSKDIVTLSPNRRGFYAGDLVRCDLDFTYSRGSLPRGARIQQLEPELHAMAHQGFAQQADCKYGHCGDFKRYLPKSMRPPARPAPHYGRPHYGLRAAKRPHYGPRAANRPAPHYNFGQNHNIAQGYHNNNGNHFRQPPNGQMQSNNGYPPQQRNANPSSAPNRANQRSAFNQDMKQQQQPNGNVSSAPNNYVQPPRSSPPSTPPPSKQQKQKPKPRKYKTPEECLSHYVDRGCVYLERIEAVAQDVKDEATKKLLFNRMRDKCDEFTEQKDNGQNDAHITPMGPDPSSDKKFTELSETVDKLQQQIDKELLDFGSYAEISEANWFCDEPKADFLRTQESNFRDMNRKLVSGLTGMMDAAASCVPQSASRMELKAALERSHGINRSFLIALEAFGNMSYRKDTDTVNEAIWVCRCTTLVRHGHVCNCCKSRKKDFNAKDEAITSSDEDENDKQKELEDDNW